MRALAAAAAAVAVCSMSCTDWRADVARWTHPQPLPASLPLVDHEGRQFTLGALRGAPVVLGFVFTRCPVADACPLTMARLAQLEQIAPDVRVLVVSIDPEHDTPAVLQAYRARHGVSFTLATGERAAVDALASMFNVVAVRRGDADIAHPVKLALLDAHLAPVRVWTDNDFTPPDIIESITHASAAQ